MHRRVTRSSYVCRFVLAVAACTLTALTASGQPLARKSHSLLPLLAEANSGTLRTVEVPELLPAGFAQPDALPPRAGTPAPRTEGTVIALDELVATAVARNPRLAKAAFTVDAAYGRYIQAGLYPNPVFAFTADELSDRTGPGGILTPQFSQEIVRGGKLKLSQAVAAKEVDQASLNLLAERYDLIGAVRATFYEAFALQERALVLRELVRLNEAITARMETAKAAGQAAEIDVLQLELERERVRAELKALEQELPAALNRLAAVVGASQLPDNIELQAPLDLNALTYKGDATRATVLAVHPEVRAARVATERASFALRRAQAEPTPNVTVSAGYTRQNQNRSNDWMIGVSMPLPVWNKNQGNIRAANAEMFAAQQDVGRVENVLSERVAVAFRTYSAARQRAEWYRDNIIKRAERAISILTDETFKPRANVTIFQVIQAQRTLAEARLEYNKSLGEAWRAAAELSGLLLEESWPLPTATAPSKPPMQPPLPQPGPGRPGGSR